MPVRAAIGACQSGKTYHLQRLVAGSLADPHSHWSFVVLDLNNEWPGEHRVLRVARATTVGGARKAIAAGEAFVVMRPPMDAQADGYVPWADVANELADIAVRAPRFVILVLPEAHLACRENYPLPKAVGSIVHRFRHPTCRSGLWVDTQHFADIKKEIVKEAQWLYLFATGAEEDLEAIRRRYGRPVAEAVRSLGPILSVRDAANKPKWPGWHVRLSILNPQDFEIIPGKPGCPAHLNPLLSSGVGRRSPMLSGSPSARPIATKRVTRSR